MAKKKAPAGKKHSIFIRANKPDEVKLLNDLAKSTHQRTYSGALMTAGRHYLMQIKEVEQLTRENEQKDAKIAQLTEILKFVHHGTEMLQSYAKKNFHAGKFPQGELFS